MVKKNKSRDENYWKVLNSLKEREFFKDTLKQLKSKRLIFTVTTGRSGTGYLAKMLSLFPSIYAFHEPEPDFVDVMRKAIEKPELAVKFWVFKKLPVIAKLLKNIYCETSHLFCKGFFYPLLDLGILPELIILRRERRKVAKSLFELDTIPGRTPLAIFYYLKPDDRGVYLPLANWQKLHDYQLCYWYCLEIEKRMEIYREEVLKRGGKVYEAEFSSLLSLEGFISFVDKMGILPSHPENIIEKLKQQIGKKINEKREEKVRKLEKELSTSQIEELEREVENLVGYSGYK
ncbi:MAG: hypothetical protein ABGX27_07015 [Desulfurobacteriaceae bacterium]